MFNYFYFKVLTPINLSCSKTSQLRSDVPARPAERAQLTPASRASSYVLNVLV